MSKIASGFAPASADPAAPLRRGPRCRRGIAVFVAVAGLIFLAVAPNPFVGNVRRAWSATARLLPGCHRHHSSGPPAAPAAHPYGTFPVPDDPFRFLPCTNRTQPPDLDDPQADQHWAALYDPDPAGWSWGNATKEGKEEEEGDDDIKKSDPYAGRGIYLCGYLDVPRDWTNATADPRIVRLAVTKYQVAGLARVDARAVEGVLNPPPPSPPPPLPSLRSNRTIVINPGGPGGSGTAYTWRAAERITQRLSGGQLDVLGWDPRGVNATQPAAACFPYDADRDRWWQLANRYRAVAEADGVGGRGNGGEGGGEGGDEEGGAFRQLAVADALNEATFRACAARLGDLPRFVSTAQVARDLDALRAALGEPTLTAFLVSYGTGIGQTYANLFPDRVGRVILDGTEFIPDEWQLGGFGWAALDNVTDAYRDGFLGECVAAGPAHCALAREEVVSDDNNNNNNMGGKDKKALEAAVTALETRLAALVARIAARPAVAYTAVAGPSIVTYSALVAAMYAALYQPNTWPGAAQMLADLERGNATLVAAMLDELVWQYDPNQPLLAPADDTVCPPGGGGDGGKRPPPSPPPPATDELALLVICADSYDAPPPADGLRWWDALWANMTATAWIAGNSRFYHVLPCRHFTTHWPQAPAGVYRGPLNHTLAHPVLLVAATHDPATPLRNGRRLAAAMGADNARLVVHHGYGHGSVADPSTACTDAVSRAYILTGALPEGPTGAGPGAETHCYADGKPYRSKVGTTQVEAAGEGGGFGEGHYDEHLVTWREHMREMRLLHPGLMRRRA